MNAPSESGEGPRFVGIIERLPDGWRASFRLRVPGEVFTQQGDTEIFATELQATKWLHTQAMTKTRLASNGSVYLPGGACLSSRGKAGSKHAQLGALEVQIVI
jgi:hypothetical protein